jgi:hypothetical protein
VGWDLADAFGLVVPRGTISFGVSIFFGRVESINLSYISSGDAPPGIDGRRVGTHQIRFTHRALRSSDHSSRLYSEPSCMSLTLRGYNPC